MADELIDIYDIDQNHIGTAMKSQAHAEGLWHKNIHCWIYDPVKKLVLFQLRAADKLVNPDKLDISVAGHVGAGEEIVPSCIREIKEELGMDCHVEELRFIGVHRDVIKEEDVLNCEFGYTYLLPKSLDVDELCLQEEEVAGAFVMTLDDCFRLFAHETDTVSAIGTVVGQDGTVKRDFTENDFADFDRHYMLAILSMIERAIEGKKYLGIG